MSSPIFIAEDSGERGQGPLKLSHIVALTQLDDDFLKFSKSFFVFALFYQAFAYFSVWNERNQNIEFKSLFE